MKALVLCAGRGTRLRPLTHTRAKAALPVAGRPVLAHILSYLKEQGFRQVGVVVSPGQGELRRLCPPTSGLSVSFIVQKHPRGIADAVAVARRFVGDEPFLLYLGDNLTNEDLTPARERFEASGAAALIAVRAVPDPRHFGVAVLDGDRVTRVVEKPDVPISNLAIAGIYFFGPEVHQAIAGLKPSARGELEITDAIAALLAQQRIVLAHQLFGWWQDMGSPEGMLAANRHILEGLERNLSPDLQTDRVTIAGPVAVGSGVRMEQVQLTGPLVIGRGAVLRNCCIGPFTSIGDGAVIENATIENSILLAGCQLIGPLFHLNGCLLGRGVVIEAMVGPFDGFLVGDHGHLRLPAAGGGPCAKDDGAAPERR